MVFHSKIYCSFVKYVGYSSWYGYNSSLGVKTRGESVILSSEVDILEDIIDTLLDLFKIIVIFIRYFCVNSQLFNL